MFITYSRTDNIKIHKKKLHDKNNIIKNMLYYLACHHSSSEAFVTCSISPYLNGNPREGRPSSRTGS